MSTIRTLRATGLASLLMLAACGSDGDSTAKAAATAQEAADRAVAAQKAAEKAAANAARYNPGPVVEEAEEPAADEEGGDVSDDNTPAVSENDLSLPGMTEPTPGV